MSVAPIGIPIASPPANTYDQKSLSPETRLLLAHAVFFINLPSVSFTKLPVALATSALAAFFHAMAEPKPQEQFPKSAMSKWLSEMAFDSIRAIVPPPLEVMI
ncbi:hypothetical protein [Parashewanella tropica]|uniref:hypothetical protein n=1 Tax=Parashewanella tropica TaxID=2547970 RepID=UPI0010594DBD|nr:hypothetical protein [Parashewanella tropica]